MFRTITSLSLAGLLLLPSELFAEEATVTVGHSLLEPAEVTIGAGDTVVFHNVDAMPGGHTIVVDDGALESPALGPDESWSHEFTTPGTYGYRIKEHPDTTGTIIVE